MAFLVTKCLQHHHTLTPLGWDTRIRPRTFAVLCSYLRTRDKVSHSYKAPHYFENPSHISVRTNTLEDNAFLLFPAATLTVTWCSPQSNGLGIGIRKIPGCWRYLKYFYFVTAHQQRYCHLSADKCRATWKLISFSIQFIQMLNETNLYAGTAHYSPAPHTLSDITMAVYRNSMRAYLFPCGCLFELVASLCSSDCPLVPWFKCGPQYST